jgi:hypothetical protein
MATAGPMSSQPPVRVVKSGSKEVRVKVVVRVRPMLEHEAAQEQCVTISDDQSIEIEREAQSIQYKFVPCAHVPKANCMKV